jgi:phosphoglycerate dehydrogenase-like enzyme
VPKRATISSAPTGAIDTLEQKTLAIIGLGQVGRMVARLARPFDMRVIGIRGSVASTDVDQLVKPGSFDAVLRQGDYVVLGLPYSTKTPGVIDAEKLGAAKNPTRC